MFSADMLLTTLILIGCMSVLAESTVRCNAGDKMTTIMVEADFRTLPVKRSYSNVKIITSNKEFRARSDEYAKAQENYDSMDTSAEVSGSYGPFSASVSAAYSSVEQSASSMSSASSSTKSGETYYERENTEEREYFEGQNQIMRDIKTTVIIDGITTVVEEQEIKTARSIDNPVTIPELHKLAQEYISRKYGDVADGEISAGGTIFTQSKCYKTPEPEPEPEDWHPKVTSTYISSPVLLYLKTKSKLRSNEKAVVYFYNRQNQKAGGIELYFTTQLKYRLAYCTSTSMYSSYYAPLTVTPPTDIDKVWEITVTAGPRVAVECNGVQVLNILVSRNTCSSFWRRFNGWNTFWSRDVSKIQFSSSDTATDSYCVGNNCM